MDIDMVLAARGSTVPPAAGRVVVAATVPEIIMHVRTLLGPEGRIGRLRIIDTFNGPVDAHPLHAAGGLAALRDLFEPSGHVEIVPGPAAFVQPAHRLPSVRGLGGFSGNFQGAGTMMSRLTDNVFDTRQLSSALGVPVRFNPS
jgi:hypothetical protein